MKIIENIKFLGSEPFTRGGFAGLYKALLYSKEFTKSEMVVVKVPDLSRIASEEGAEWTMGRAKALERWKREIRAGQSVLHPNIVHVLGSCSNPDPAHKEFIGIVLPYYKNGNASSYIQVHPDADRLRILIYVAAALSALHAHESPVVHGDIKATNILIDDYGRPLLADFGLSRICETSGFTTKSIMGSVRWMAPELLQAWIASPQEGDQVVQTTCASDIWAFAMTIFEILTNTLPFSEYKHDPGIMFGVALRKERPTKPCEPHIHHALWTLLEHCWAESPSARPYARHVGLILDLIYSLGGRELDVSTVSMILSGALDDLCPLSSRSGRPTPRPYACKWPRCLQAFDTIDECVAHEREELNRRISIAGSQQL